VPGADLLLAAAADGEPDSLTWTAAVVAWVLAVPLWGLTRWAYVVGHEGGHAVALKLLGRKLESIRLSRAGGATKPADKLPWLISVVATFAGYVAPSLFGVVAAWLLVRGLTTAVLWASAVFLLFMLLAVRGWLGWIVVPALLVLIVAVAVRSEPAQQRLFAHVWTWFLLISAVQRMLVFMRGKTYQNPTSDAGALRQLTKVPAALWAVVFLLGTVAGLVYGGALLLRLHPGP
jgi:hypothetical protein